MLTEMPMDGLAGVPAANRLTLELVDVGDPANSWAEVRGGRTPYERYVKRAFDLVGATFLLLLVAPTLLLVALAIRMDLGRRVIFRQQRVGLDGRVFSVHKFRSMHPCRRTGDRPIDHPDRRQTHKHPADPRLTPLGRFLRKWSIDELPQLWDVIRGEMSLVGPRPEMLSIVDRYAPWQHERHRVKPGLTGLWQVTGRGEGEMHDNTHLDIEYVRQLSFRTDLAIALRTIPALVRRKGY